MIISVCMITWNEEALLPLAVGSVKGLADEVVVVDTGSTDRTVEVAISLGCIVKTGADRMNKGLARNQAIDASSGDWIVILDADEQIADPASLRRHIETTDADALYIQLAYVGANNQPTLSYAQMRCWRRGTYCYHYRAHEVPVGNGKVEYTGFVWEHRPPAERVWKSQYTLDRLLLDVKENPGDSRPLYYLGRQYMYRQDWQQAKAILEQYLADPGNDKADAWHCISKCHAGMGDEQAQIKALYQACAACPSRREWWCELAGIYHAKRQDNVAVGLLKCALEQPQPARSYVPHAWYGSGIYDLLARCLWKLGRYEEGQQYARQALELDPDNKRLRKNLLWFDAQLGDMDAFYLLHGPNIHSGCQRHKAIAELVEGPRVLDIGCGTGDLLLLLQERGGFELCGTDVSSEALDMARSRGLEAELRHTDGLPPWVFNTVVMSQVLEHLEDDAAMINEAADRLVPGGLLIVSVPHDGRIPSPDHKREYGVKDLMALLSNVGNPTLHSWPGERDRILMSVRCNGTA